MIMLSNVSSSVGVLINSEHKPLLNNSTYVKIYKIMNRFARNVLLSGGAVATGLLVGAGLYEFGERPDLPMERIQDCTNSFANKDRASDIPKECQGFNRIFEYHTEPVDVINSNNGQHEVADGKFYWILPKPEVFVGRANEVNEQDQRTKLLRVLACGAIGVAVTTGLNYQIWRGKSCTGGGQVDESGKAELTSFDMSTNTTKPDLGTEINLAEPTSQHERVSI